MKLIDILRISKLRKGTLIILLASISSLFASCISVSEPTVTLPKGVVSLHVFVQGDPAQRVHFETHYQIKDGPLTNVKPGAGTVYKERVNFRGKIIPLAVTDAGGFVIPISYAVAIMPDGSPWVKQRPAGELYDLGGGDTLYEVKLRTQEKGLVFVLLPEKGEFVWIYPSKEKPLIPSDLPISYIEHSEKIRRITIPPLSTLEKIRNSDISILSSLVSNREGEKGEEDTGKKTKSE